jgi:hypothetical protein
VVPLPKLLSLPLSASSVTATKQFEQEEAEGTEGGIATKNTITTKEGSAVCFHEFFALMNISLLLFVVFVLFVAIPSSSLAVAVGSGLNDRCRSLQDPLMKSASGSWRR